jgi:hypothetical protein
MGLSTSELLQVLQQMHPSWDQRALAARVKYFTRDGWPSDAVRAGRGSRLLLGADDIMKLVFVMELLDASVPPTPAREMVEEGWRELRFALASSWNERATRTAALPVIVHASADDAASRVAIAATADEVRRWLAGRDEFRWLLLLDAARVAKSLDRALREVLAPSSLRALTALIDDWTR